MARFYAQMFDNQKKALLAPGERYHGRTDIEAKQLLYVETPNENIWGDHPHEFEIFANKDGIGYRVEHPAGYSSYTYDPETEDRFYVGATWDWFKSQVLDEDQRQMIKDVRGEEEILRGLTEEQRK